MPKPCRDATVKFERQALAHCLKALFKSKLLVPDEAIADAIGVDREHVKKSKFIIRLGRGYAAGIPGTGLRLQDVVDRLREEEGIRPATEMWGAALWSFLRGELTPDVGISELLDHHLARVKFTRVATGQDFVSLLSARANNGSLDTISPLRVITRARLFDIERFLVSTVPVADKLTITGLLYIKAYLGGDPDRSVQLAKEIRTFCGSRAYQDAFGPRAAGNVWIEIRDRLFHGQLPYSYGQRSTKIVRWPVDILLPTDDTERALDFFIMVALAGARYNVDAYDELRTP